MKQYVLVPRDTLQAHYNTLEAYCGYTDEEVTELRNLLAEPCEPVGHFMPTETNPLGTVTKWVQMHSPHGTPLYTAPPGANPDALIDAAIEGAKK